MDAFAAATSSQGPSTLRRYLLYVGCRRQHQQYPIVDALTRRRTKLFSDIFFLSAKHASSKIFCRHR
ncbi:hypothetical protein Csa_016431 [Cucumis sativus]|uniref:Uncharacterized protein n=1 Tax=Cucumis sativus TaxID=3659 RepID=A0A0A0K9V6_CUCSA|nr:hypothetical protein Csa_016431 [Cucumis sativus]